MKIAPFALRHTAVAPTPGMPRLFSAGALLMTLCLTACGGGGGGSAAGHDLLADNAQTSQSGNTANNGTAATGTSSGNASNSASNLAGGAGGVSTPQPLNGQPPLGENSASVRPQTPANNPGSTSSQPSPGSNGSNARGLPVVPARVEPLASPAARTTPETQEAQVTPTTPAARAPRVMAVPMPASHPSTTKHLPSNPTMAQPAVERRVAQPPRRAPAETS